MRRICMLLFVLVLTVVIMAVPALAADHDHGTCIVQTGTCSECGVAHGEGWKSLSEVTGSEIPEGKYYVPEGGITKGFSVTGGQSVTICLNGQVWSGNGTTRPLRIAGDGTTVKIVDCSARTDYISKGRINGVAMTNDGSAIHISNRATLYIYNGVISGQSAANGGAIKAQKSTGDPTVYFINGKIIGGTASKNGGGVAIQYGGTFYMGNEETAKIGVGGRSIPVIEGGSAANGNGGSVCVDGGSFRMESGAIRNGSAKNGGSVYAKDGTFIMSQGLIDGGNATTNGGNIYLGSSGTFRMSEGLVENGSVNNNSISSAANLYANTGTLEMTGGQISGYVHILTYQATNDHKVLVKLSGTAKIVKKNANGDAIGGLYYQIGKDSDWRGITPLRVGNFESGAEIYVGVLAADAFVEGVSTCLIKKVETDGAAYENFMKKDVTGDGQVTWADYEDALRYIHLYSTGSAISYEENGIYLHSTAGNLIYHCLCCGDQPAFYANGIKHVGDCDGYDVAWTPYAMKDKGALPSEEGYYYLVDSDGTSDYSVVGSITQVEYKTSVDVYIDMNGLSYNTARRVAKVTVADAHVTFTNSKATGGFVFDDKNLTENYHWDAFEVSGTAGENALNFYRVTVDGSKYSPKEAFVMVKAGECNFYSATVNGANSIAYTSGSTTYSGKGGVAYIHAAGTLNMEGCCVTGGNVPGSGSVFYVIGKAELTNCTITGGTAGAAGGAIYIFYDVNNADKRGEAVLTNCTLTDFSSDAKGGIIYAGYKLTLNNCEISGGVAGNGENDGNNLYVDSKGEVTIDGGFVAGGVRLAGNPTLTLSGDVKINNGGTATNSGIYLIPDAKFNVSGVTADADILLLLANPTAKKQNWCLKVDSGLVLDAFNLIDNLDHVDMYLINVDDTIGWTTTIETDTYGALRNRVLYSTSKAALAGAKDGDFVKLFAGAENAVVNNDIALDLNGKSVTGLTVNNKAEIKLFDSSAIEYVAGSGYVTLASGQTNPFVRDFTTKGIIDRNLRFVTIAETDGEGNITQYSAHRIYLAVRSTVLYPKTSRNEVAIGFRIALRCDNTLVDYITAYGLIGKGDISKKVPTTGYYGEGADNDNTKYIGLTYGTNTNAADKPISGQAFLTITDGISAMEGDDVFSSAVETSLMSMVKSVDEKYDTLSDTQKGQLDDMFAAYQTIMSGWDLKNIKVPEPETQG